jgi:hypothetical protein
MSRPKKEPIGLTPEFQAEIASLTTDELKAKVVLLQVQYQENEAFKETPKFQSAQEEFDYAKERYNQVAGPIKETAQVLKNRTKAVIETLKEKGGA